MEDIRSKEVKMILAMVITVAAVFIACFGGESEIDAGSDASKDGQEKCRYCEKKCENKECGDDGCGWICGECPVPVQCSDMGFRADCMHVSWPDCTGFQCGPDPVVGASCGKCPDEWSCFGGICVPNEGGCGSVDENGECVAGWALRCQEGELVYNKCSHYKCEINQETGKAECKKWPCLKNCFGRTCGDDGCDGFCGECGEGEKCDNDKGVCIPENDDCLDGYFNARCEGHVLIECVDKKLITRNCIEEGKICTTDTKNGSASCCPIMGEVGCSGMDEIGRCINGHIFKCIDGNLEVIHCKLMGYNCGWIDYLVLGCNGNYFGG